jgi:hypothetical protein
MQRTTRNVQVINKQSTYNELRNTINDKRMRPQAAIYHRASDITSDGHAEAPGSGVVGFDNFRQAAREL